MGRVRSRFIKRTSRKIFNKHGDEISSSFDENKAIVEKHADFPSKKLRNVVVGYITKLKRDADKEKK